jgi:hypothetical protein
MGANLSESLMMAQHKQQQQQQQPPRSKTSEEGYFIFHDEAIENVVKYLQSEEFKNRGDTKDSIHSIPQLVKMNELGLLTTNSQPGIKQTGTDEKGKSWVIDQRSYVQGFMLVSDAQEFMEIFNTDLENDKICISTTVIDSNKHILGNGDKEWKERFPLTLEDGKPFTRSYFTIDKDYFETVGSEVKFASKNRYNVFVLILCIDPKWNRNANDESGLNSQILKVLQQISRNKKQ